MRKLRLHLNAGFQLRIFGNRSGKHVVNRGVDDDGLPAHIRRAASR